MSLVENLLHDVAIGHVRFVGAAELESETPGCGQQCNFNCCQDHLLIDRRYMEIVSGVFAFQS